MDKNPRRTKINRANGRIKLDVIVYNSARGKERTKNYKAALIVFPNPRDKDEVEVYMGTTTRSGIRCGYGLFKEESRVKSVDADSFEEIEKWLAGFNRKRNF